MKALKYLFLLPAALNLAGHWAGIPLLCTVSKPLLMPLLALTVFLLFKAHDIRGRRVATLIPALLFGALGDILLMPAGTAWFLGGMAAFLIGHILYFSTLPAPWKVRGRLGNVLSLGLLAVLLTGVVRLAGRFPLEGVMKGAVTAYACAFAFLIHACIVAAIDRKKPLYLVTALGFALFAFSDSLVAVGAFTDWDIPRRGFLVMATYIAAQATVAFSVAGQEIRDWEKTAFGLRARRLRALWDGLRQQEAAFLEAFEQDFGKGAFEAYTTEIGYLYADLRHTLNHLRDWMEPRTVPTPFVLWPGRSRILSEPYGKVLIIGPFNYPLHLAIAPLTAALAAGNTAVVKPSRQTPHVSAVVTRMLENAFPPDVVSVAGPEVSNEELLAHRFDYIFFTGSPRVGSIVMEAASKHLTPVTLELGGKSPAIVCAHAPLRLACERIAKGKFLNGGQTCVAPDYVLVHTSVHEAFIATMKEVIADFFGDISTRPAEMTLLATDRHFERVAALIREPVIGGHTDPAQRYIAPTVLDNASWDEPAMREEIFGPVLPVIVYRDLQTEVIDKVRAWEKPLSLYVFSRSRREVRSILSQVSFGGGCVNETVMHLGNANLPFGGVGQSGMGAYHGRTGFETFSHAKSVLFKSAWLNFDLLKPPYGRKLRLIRKVYK